MQRTCILLPPSASSYANGYTSTHNFVRSILFVSMATPIVKTHRGKEQTTRRRLKSGCMLEAALQVIGGKWKVVIIHYLLERKHRYGELRRAVPNCTQRILTLQLRELERDEL